MNLVTLLAVSLTTLPQTPACPDSRQHSEVVSQAEASLGASLPVYVFCVYGVVDEKSVWLSSIGVYEESTGRHVEELSPPKYLKDALGLFFLSEIEGSALRPKLVDFNFDGYLDVSLLAYRGATGNSGSNIWLFQPNENTFVYNDALSTAGQLHLDPERRELTSRSNGGHSGRIYSTSVYRWIGGKVTEVRHESQDWDKERNCYDFRVWEWQDGQLVEKVRKCAPIHR